MLVDKDRLMALSDGIVAIAATIMVLELYVPTELNFQSIIVQIPTFVSFFVSFILIYLSWTTHQKIFNKIDEINGHMLITNTFWLLFTSLVPFVTKLKNTFPNSRFAAIEYITILVLWLLSMEILDKIAVNSNPNIKKDEISTNKSRTMFVIGIILVYIIAYFYPNLTNTVLVIFSILTLAYVYNLKK